MDKPTTPVSPERARNSVPTLHSIRSISDIVGEKTDSVPRKRKLEEIESRQNDTPTSRFHVNSVQTYPILKHQHLFLPNFLPLPITSYDHVTAQQLSSALALRYPCDTRYCSSRPQTWKEKEPRHAKRQLSVSDSNQSAIQCSIATAFVSYTYVQWTLKPLTSTGWSERL